MLPTHLGAVIMTAVESLVVKTARLHLKSANVELAAADLNDSARLARLLQAELPDNWPPPLNDENSKTYTLNYLKQNPDAAGWAAWYFVLPAALNKKGRVIGIGGFTGKPSKQGIVEVGYSVIPDHQRSGFASEALAALIDWAFSHQEVQLVTAQTLPALVASIRVLEKNGFHLDGPGSEEGVIHFTRERTRT